MQIDQSVIEKFQVAIERFSNFDWEFMPSEGEHEIVFDFFSMNDRFYQVIKELEKLIQGLFLACQYENILNFRKLLINTKTKLSISYDFGIRIDFPNQKSTGIIEPEVLKQLIDVRVKSINRILELIEELELSKTETIPHIGRTEIFKKKLNHYGFFDLEKVMVISDLDSFFNLFVDNSAPYQIAMLQHLDFLAHLRKEHAPTIKKRNQILADILSVSFDTVKNNVNYLDKSHPKGRYTSSLHKFQVIDDYMLYK